MKSFCPYCEQTTPAKVVDPRSCGPHDFVR